MSNIFYLKSLLEEFATELTTADTILNLETYYGYIKELKKIQNKEEGNLFGKRCLVNEKVYNFPPRMIKKHKMKKKSGKETNVRKKLLDTRNHCNCIIGSAEPGEGICIPDEI